MIDHFLYRYIQERVKELLLKMLPPMVEELVDAHIISVAKLEPNHQYLVFLRNEEDAKAMVDGIKKYLDEKNIPNLAILVSQDEPQFLEITPKRS